ncbi:MAG: anaerobic selenocysteine-containing dehydrogenase [Gammaproteobacteria bacterium]
MILGPKIVEPPDGCRSNHELICELAQRLGVEHRGFTLSSREIIDWTLQNSGWGTLEELENVRWIDCQSSFDEAHYIDGFGHADGRFHFAPDWSQFGPDGFGPEGDYEMPPKLPDHWDSIEAANASMPFRLVTAPARHYLNSTFNETPSSARREQRPTVMLHPDDAERLGVAAGQMVTLGNDRGELSLAVELFEGLQNGVVIVESIWPNSAFPGGQGINVLTGADPIAPTGGAAFHDNRIWIKAVATAA